MVYPNCSNRRPARVVRYAPAYLCVQPYRYGYYRPARVVPYGCYGPAYRYYYSPVRYHRAMAWPYRSFYGYGWPYGGLSIGIEF